MAETGGLVVINFETGDTSQFTSIVKDAGMTVEAHADAKNNGSYGMRIYNGNSTSNDGRGTYTIADKTTLYVRFYIKVDATYTMTSTDLHYLLTIYDDTTILYTMGLHRNAAEVGAPDIWRMSGQGLANTERETGLADALGDWVMIEVLWAAGTGANGGIRFYVDGVEDFSDIDQDLTAYAIDSVHIGLRAGAPASGKMIYIDDIKVAETGPIGAYSEGGGSSIVPGVVQAMRRRR